MTIYGVARATVLENPHGLLKRGKEQVLGCTPLSPGEYKISHAPARMKVSVAEDDSVAIDLHSILRLTGTGGFLEFAGSALVLTTIWGDDRSKVLKRTVAVTPNYGAAALRLGPDVDGITLSLERYKLPNDAPIAIGLFSLADIQPVIPPVAETLAPVDHGGGVGGG